ncbi:MAG: type II toxin-antitoxin system prevent-host-death family antitoxin [Candidatus Scalindua sp.]|nr:type II toxin-antitoxin system prevent-host-death family antitoxin [Candidatus Scalindua sp.]
MSQVNVHQAKIHLSRLIDKVANGTEKEIVIAKSGKPKAELIPFDDKPVKRLRRLMKGKIKISKNFEDPLPEDAIQSFYK